MLKYYIATRLSHSHKHNVLRDMLAEEGYVLTYDWTTHGSQKHTSHERLKEIGELELNAIKEADVVFVLLPGGKGTHTELGYALGLGKPILLHSEDESSFELGEEICAFYCVEGVTKMVGSLKDIKNQLRTWVHPHCVSS